MSNIINCTPFLRSSFLCGDDDFSDFISSLSFVVVKLDLKFTLNAFNVYTFYDILSCTLHILS